MKLSIVLSLQPASFSALAYKGHWEENIAKIRHFGYDGVELAVRDPGLLDMPLLNCLLTGNGLVVPAVGTGQAYGEEGLSFTHPESNVRRRAVERVCSHVDLAAELRAVVIVGLVRGKREPSIAEGLAQQWLVDALRECAARNKKVLLAVEPINRYETNLINTVRSGLDLVEKLGMENVGLLLDTFHMNIEEPSIPASILSTGDRLFHFHVADSNRWYPGAGHTDFRPIVDVLERISYKGFLSAEIVPLPDPDAAAQNTIKFMRSLTA
ncbi:MAG TPA: 5-keto-L-gluconate epimerase [Acidobacteriota bacterium]|nr:5-keto-L-gluconate epimerase [Acidobacteriota bacterium]